MKKAAKILGILAILTAGAFISGCKSAPPLTQADAQAMIQAKYDQTPPQPFTIVLNDLGMRQGISDKFQPGRGGSSRGSACRDRPGRRRRSPW